MSFSVALIATSVGKSLLPLFALLGSCEITYGTSTSLLSINAWSIVEDDFGEPAKTIFNLFYIKFF